MARDSTGGYDITPENLGPSDGLGVVQEMKDDADTVPKDTRSAKKTRRKRKGKQQQSPAAVEDVSLKDFTGSQLIEELWSRCMDAESPPDFDATLVGILVRRTDRGYVTLPQYKAEWAGSEQAW